ncbi:MAG: dephospho-CoA kinase [Gracilimonas sp.]|uniref:dephospho-CoA kinase n=1 Tax=Gracilimonas sp. TaxID=1974203 RepID=UPI0037518A79|nr:dephospho-CoA kinase [Gracilimonas sp.]
MIKVGVTGGIGSGKTTLCKEWGKMGAYILYADDLAKKLMNENEELKSKIVKVFGEQSYDASGDLDRSYLASEAFEKGRVEELNELVHPVLWKKAKDIAEEKKREGVKVFAKEAAILLNNGRPKGLDYVVLLLADEENRIDRTKERDQTSENRIRDRISKQPDFNELIPLADLVITNDGSLEELKNKSRQVFKNIIEQTQ